MSRKPWIGASAALLLLSGAAAAQSATTITTYGFSAQTEGPVTSVSGTFEVAYDDVADTHTLKSATIKVGSVNFDLNSDRFDHQIQFYAQNGFYALGGAITGPDIVQQGVDDFRLIFTYSDFSFSRFDYSQFFQFNKDWSATSISLERVSSVVVGEAVPEPATWAMMIGGFGLAGAALRLRGKLATS